MADTTTTNYALVKPEVGGSDTTWGTKLNADLDSIDTLLKALADADAVTQPINKGGTGAVTASAARTNLGFTTAGSNMGTAADVAAQLALLGVSNAVNTNGSAQTDLNSASSASGFFRCAASATNAPTTDAGHVLVIRTDASNITQLFMSLTTDDIWMRRRLAGTWLPWVEISHSAQTILNNTMFGNVSGSAAAPGQITAAQFATWLDTVGGRAPLFRAPVAVTSGANVTIDAAVPSYARRLTIILDNISNSSGSQMLIQIGPTGGIETTGYDSGAGVLQPGSGIATSGTAGYNLPIGTAADALTGTLTLTKPVAAEDFWIMSGTVHRGAGEQIITGGRKTLAGALTQLRINTTSGNFDGTGRIILGIE